MEQQQISAKKQKALDKVKRANAELAKVVREEKEQLRKTQDRHKYMMGGRRKKRPAIQAAKTAIKLG